MSSETRDFTADLEYSRSFRECALNEILLDRIPGASHITVAGTSDDRNGTDYWVHRFPGTAYSIDLKLRKPDYGDLTLEIWSKMPTDTHPGRIGWTRDATKDTDYILWFWAESGRFLIMPFAPLWQVFSEHWQDWLRLASVRDSGVRENVSTTRDKGQEWRSQCLFVREDIVVRQMKMWARGYVRRSALNGSIPKTRAVYEQHIKDDIPF